MRTALVGCEAVLRELYEELTRCQRACSGLAYIATEIDPDDRFEF
jgi:hypothetical protein